MYLPLSHNSSGTHENDFGLFLLKEEVRWKEGPMSACVGRGGVLARNCVVVGFDTNEEVITVNSRVVSAYGRWSQCHRTRHSDFSNLYKIIIWDD
ncbi:hypothetical protein RR48_00126 [Papilio machaon]|uniref:Uncharacterized protein n=1 Tax=Papilio machaon TaxID=76193 RepID=A0A0N1IJT4_PAPMA|nr:hypothetical protein RR48_00126 [Papilio machaon]